jgi:hypothetical protein
MSFLGTTKLTATYTVRGRLTMDKYREIMCDAKVKELPLPVTIVAQTNEGPNGSPNYVFVQN